MPEVDNAVEFFLIKALFQTVLSNNLKLEDNL